MRVFYREEKRTLQAKYKFFEKREREREKEGKGRNTEVPSKVPLSAATITRCRNRSTFHKR